ncbi:glycosyltransferase family 1 protein [uncultured Gordonia sp.]|uniref:glycosyltransferase family 4 protein n=1 Tax=uncultured Gordonia sp. TaxID=198437 RepID=UPI00258A6301|nr:glycosyltransferase family 1 protein [uncultured Gordonia sp.]
MPRRILDRHVGGNTTYARSLAGQLRDRGHTVDGFGGLGHPLANTVRETAAGIRSAELDLVHYVADTGPLVRTRVPSVVTVHGVASRWIDTGRTPMAERIWRTRVARAIDSCDRIITVSQASAIDVAEVFDIDPNRIDVIYHGIEHTGIEQADENDPPVRTNIRDLDDYILYLGNLEPRKNVAALIRAMADVPAGVTLVIAGKPAWAADAIMAEIANSPRVVHLGFVSDSEREHLMRHCRLFVFPSRYEGFGLPVLEALAHGCPVLCSRRGALAEVAGPAFELAEIDESAIAAGITDALAAVADDDTRTRLADAGRDWARQFNWQRSAEAHLAVYEELLT